MTRTTMRSRWARAAAIGLLAVGLFAAAPTSAAEVATDRASESGDLSSYFVEAAQANPQLRASYENWQAALEKVAFAKGWPDPKVSYTLYLQEVETALGPQKHAIALMQMFPWFGKLSLKGSAQEQAALAASERFRRARLDLFTKVARAYYDLAYLNRSIEITHENLEILRYHEAVARARYRTDNARYSDLIKVQVELASLEDRLQTLKDRERPLTAGLNRSLGREATAPLEWPVGLASDELSTDDTASIRDRALTNNPMLLAMQHDVDRHETMARLANRNRYPDFSVGVKSIVTDESELTNFADRGRDAWMLTLGLNLPLWQGKYKAAVRSEVAAKRGAEAKLTDTRHAIDAQLEGALFELRDAQRKIDLFGDGLVPKAQQSLESTSTAYQAGTKTFLDVLDAQRTLLVFELDLARAKADLGRQRVAVLSLMGELPAGVHDFVVDAAPEEGAER